MNTVRSEIWGLVFPHHSCQNLVKSLVFDSWFDKIFWQLWCGKSHTHISSSQYSLIVKNCYSKETVEQWSMYTLYKVRVKLEFTATIAVFLQWENTVRRKCEYGFFHITNAKKSCEITSQRRVIWQVFGMSDLENPYSPFRSHSILIVENCQYA